MKTVRSTLVTRRYSMYAMRLAVGLAVAWIPSIAEAGRFRSFAAGDGVTCFVTGQLGLWCWGRNDVGQLGDGSRSERHWPKLVATSAVAPSTRDDTTCYIPFGLRARCAGANEFGQLGDGTTVARSSFLTVTSNPNLSADVFEVTGGKTPCQYNEQGEVSCWGWNQQGAVGDGTTTNRLVPTTVPGLKGVRSLVTSGANGRTCAVTHIDGDPVSSMWCWGNNDNDMLGGGPGLGSFSATPVKVKAFTSVSTSPFGIAVGLDHTCAIASPGGLSCWGRNDHGQLGDGSTNDSTQPVIVSVPGETFANVTVSSNGAFTCARTASFKLYCWGRNDRGQLGDGTTIDRHQPVFVSEGAFFIAAGNNHACFSTGTFSNERAYCWGANSHGQVGDGTTTDRHTPTAVVLTPGRGVAATSNPLRFVLALLLVVVGAIIGFRQHHKSRS